MNLKPTAAILFCSTQLVFSQQPTMHTESAQTLGKGKVQAGLAMEYLKKDLAPTPEFPQSMLRLFMVGWHHGVADNVNLDLDWLGRLSASFPNNDSKFDWGDLTVSTKVTFFKESDKSPAIAVRTAVKLPNSSYTQSRLGSNQTDFHSSLLFSKHFDDVETRLNLRFSIVGDPVDLGVQDDVYGFNAAVIAPLATGLRFFAELIGFAGYTAHNSKLLGRYGMMLELERFDCSLYSSLRAAGDSHDYGNAFESSENWSVGFSVAHTFSLEIE